MGAGDGAKPMTSVFYDVIFLEAVRGSSSVPTEGHFWRFLGECEPENVVGHRVDPKRHFLTSQRVLWAIFAKIYTRLTSVVESGKNKYKKERPYISRISPGASLRPIGTSFGLHVRLVDLINCAKFYRNWLRGLDSVRVEVWPFPLDCDVAVNTAWN